MFNHIRIVLVAPTHPGNIGATARAMKTMGLSRLYLVTPKIFPHADATAMAAGADDILMKAVVTSTLEEAISDCDLVFGTSARNRKLSAPLLDSHQCVQHISDLQTKTQVALIFGREHAGLTNEELQHCHYHVHIPVNPDFRSLNLAASVQVLCYEIRLAMQEKGEIQKNTIKEKEPLATADELEKFYEHLEKTLVDIDYLNPAQPRLLMQRLRRLYQRARPERRELQILRGILTKTQHALQSTSKQ